MDIINTPIPVGIFLEFIFEYLFYVQQKNKYTKHQKINTWGNFIAANQ